MNLLFTAILGHDVQQSRLRRPWSGLRRSMPKALPEVEGQTIRWTQPVRPGCDRRFDYVSPTTTRMPNHLLTNTSIAEHWWGSKRGWPSKVNGMRSSGLSSPRTTRIGLRLGSRIFSGSSRYSTCVRLALLGIREFRGPLLDRAGNRYQHGGG
jgi:hypothetical protein